MEFVKRLDIKSFGSYSDFVWKGSIRNSKNEVEDFRKLNILYGRNYSGKTTLSKIFRSFETGHLKHSTGLKRIPPKYFDTLPVLNLKPQHLQIHFAMPGHSK